MTGRASHTGPLDWDAETYDEVSDPQFAWGTEVLGRLDLDGDEAVLDAGCGSGRVTAELAKLIPRGRLVAVDGSEAMIAKARERLGDEVTYLVADLTELQLAQRVDLVFSTATFHWILDHDLLFRRLHAVLAPGGRLVAQCGGRGNIAAYSEALAAVEAQPEFRPHMDGIRRLLELRGARGDRTAAPGRRLRRGAVLAGAEAGHPGAALRVHRDIRHRPSAGQASRRTCGAPSPRPCSSGPRSR